MKKILTEFGINMSLMMAGLFGALIFVAGKKNVNIKASIVGVVSGTFSANYLTPLVINIFGITQNLQFGIAFLLGYLGLKGMERVFIKAQEKYHL
jgi:hypothetical protein